MRPVPAFIAAALLMAPLGCGRGDVPDASGSPEPSINRPHWKEFESVEGGFKVKLPGDPVMDSKSLGSAGSRKMRMVAYSVENPKGTLYAIRFVELPGNPKDKAVEEGFEAIRKRMAAEMGDRMEKFTERNITMFGRPGREWKIQLKATDKDPAVAKVTRMYVFEGRTYQLDYAKKGTETDAADLRLFFDSFHVPAARLEEWK